MSKSNNNQELEVRFLNIDYVRVVHRLKEVGAKDLGEEFLREVIFADQALTWPEVNRLIRLRSSDKGGTKIAYKHHRGTNIGEVDEVEFEIPDFEKAKDFLELIGFVSLRHQEKKRHSFVLDTITFDIDTWPNAPTYIEIEGSSEKELKKAAKLLGFDWEKVVHEDAKKVLEGQYGIPISRLKFFTFDRIEE